MCQKRKWRIYPVRYCIGFSVKVFFFFLAIGSSCSFKLGMFASLWLHAKGNMASKGSQESGGCGGKTSTTSGSKAASTPATNTPSEASSLNSVYNSYGGYPNFMHSSGLRMWNQEDHNEAKSIAQAFLDADRQAAKGRSSSKSHGNQ